MKLIKGSKEYYKHLEILEKVKQLENEGFTIPDSMTVNEMHKLYFSRERRQKIMNQ